MFSLKNIIRTFLAKNFVKAHFSRDNSLTQRIGLETSD